MKALFTLLALVILAPAARAEKLNCVIADPTVYYRLKFDTATGVMTHNDFPNNGFILEYKNIKLKHVGGKDFQLVDRKGNVFASLNLGWGGYDFYENPRKTSYPYYIRLHKLKNGLTGGCGSDKHPTFKSN